MTEKEKMLKGLPYNPAKDEILIEERFCCKELCRDYNDLRPRDMEGRTALLHRIFGKIEGDVIVEQPFFCDYGYNISIGRNFFSNHNLVILDCAPVSFGDNVFIAPNCGFYTAGHPVDPEERRLGLEYAKPIRIGNDVWIGGGVSVLPGVTIGNNVIIGAGSVVTRDIPSDSVAVGNPCRVIRKINPA